MRGNEKKKDRKRGEKRVNRGRIEGKERERDGRISTFRVPNYDSRPAAHPLTHTSHKMRVVTEIHTKYSEIIGAK